MKIKLSYKDVKLHKDAIAMKYLKHSEDRLNENPEHLAEFISLSVRKVAGYEVETRIADE